MIRTDKTLDIKGLANPRPTVITERTLQDMRPGQVLRVITDDRSTKQTFPQLCRERGYELLDLQEEVGILFFTIRK
jgi:TusA-related sulfurtransferase